MASWAWLLPLLTAALMAALWWVWGRDPGLGCAVRVEYQPPPGLTPAEAGALVDERADDQDVLATLVDLGVRGFLAVEPAAGEDFVFRRCRPLAGDPGLTALERRILERVFGQDLSLSERRLSELRRDAAYVLAPLRDAIDAALVARRLVVRSPFWVRQGWGWTGAAFLFAAGAVVAGAPPQGWTLATALALSGLVVLAFAPAMPRRSWRGARVRLHLLGFREFLARAERDRLERLPPDTLHRWLPWAIALGVSPRWIARFRGRTFAPPHWWRDRQPLTLEGYERSLERLRRAHREALTISA